MIRLAFVIVLVSVAIAMLVPKTLPTAAPTDRTLVVDAKPIEASESSSDGSGLILSRDGHGQFHLTAQVNGQDTDFLVDTGADHVVLNLDEARRIGLYIDDNAMQPIMQTASGVGYGQAVTIDRLTVAGHELDHVDAIVAKDVGFNLLGQSALKQLGKVEIDRDHMTIR